MTAVSNIFVGISSWAPSTTYSVGNRFSNGSNAYQCITAGTSASSGGPSGTGSLIPDGTAAWKYLAHIDYISLGTWASGIPATLTQPVIGQLWDCGAITTTSGTPYFSLSGHTTSSTNTITLTTAPGESIRDLLIAGNLALAADYSATGGVGTDPFSTDFSPDFGGGTSTTGAGVRFVLPSSGAGNTNYITINDSNVIVDGLQFIDPNSASNCSHVQVGTGATNSVIRSCIFDGYAQAGGASILDIEGQIDCYNCLIVDRQPATSSAQPITFYSSTANGSRLVNCGLIGVNGNTGNGAALQVTASSCYVRNCYVFGYAVLQQSGTTGVTFDHCGLSNGSITSPSVSGSGNILGLSSASQFINPASDWRVKIGSSLISKGISDTTDIPTIDDIERHARVGWTIGPWEFFLSLNSSSSFTVLRASGHASLTTTTNGASSRVSLGNFRSSASMGQIDRTSGSARLFFIQPSILVNQANQANSNGSPWSSDFSQDFGPFSNAIQVNVLTFISNVSPIGYVVLTEFGSASSQVLSISSVGIVSVSNAAGQASIPPLSCLAVASMLGATVNFSTISCIASATPILVFSGASNINLQPSISASCSTTALASGSLGLRVASAVSQYDAVYCISSIPTLSIASAIGTSCSAVTGIPSLAAVSNVGQYNVALSSTAIEALTVGRPMPAMIQTDGAAPVLLAADGSGLIIAADIAQPNLTSVTFGSGLAFIPPLSSTGFAFQQLFLAGAVSALQVYSAAQCQQFNQITGAELIIPMSARGAAVLSNFVAGTATLENMAGAGLFGQRVVASGISGGLFLSTVSQGQQFSQATGADSLLAISSSVSALLSNGAVGLAAFTRMTDVAAFSMQDLLSGASALEQLTAAGTMQSITTATAIVNVASLTGHGIAGTGAVATGAVSLEGMSASGSVSVSQVASGSSPMIVSTIGLVALSLGISGGASIQIAASGIAGFSVSASTAGLVLAVSASGTLSSTTQADGQTSLVSVAGFGMATNTVEFANTTSSAMTINAVSTAALLGSDMSGEATIGFGMNGQIINSIEAAVLVELEQIVATHAQLWTTPIGYVQGDDLIFWID